MRGHLQEVELVGAEAERVADAEVELAGDEAVDEEVAGALHARGAVDELGGEVAVARLERRALEQLREQQVGVGAVALDAIEGVERELPGGDVTCRAARRGAEPGAVGPRLGVHPALALGLDLDELHLAVGRPHAGAVPDGGHVRAPHLEALAVVGRPRVAEADPAVDVDGGAAPVEVPILGGELVGVGRLADLRRRLADALPERVDAGGGCPPPRGAPRSSSSVSSGPIGSSARR